MSSQSASANSQMDGAFRRFRFMAFWAGVMSLLLWFVDLPVKWWVHNDSLHSHLVWIPIVHGFTYPIYVLATFHYCLKSRKSFSATIFFLLAGTLPIASFVAENRAAKEYRARHEQKTA